MHMNVKPIPALDPRINEIRALTAQIVNREILPNERKLWAPHLPPEYGGAGRGFLEHGYMNEVLPYGMGAAALFDVVAPNSGNQKILLKYGREEQKRKWLVPLTEGTMESGFSKQRCEGATR